MNFIYQEFQELSSTNDLAKSNMANLCKNSISIISSKHQTKGRGKFDKKWLSKQGDLFTSICFFTDISNNDTSCFVLPGAIAVKEFLFNEGLRDIRIKWPNDVLIQDQKICGILCETQEVEDKLGVIIGIGLNINSTKHLLSEVDQKCTSMHICTGKTYSVHTINKLVALYVYNELNKLNLFNLT